MTAGTLQPGETPESFYDHRPFSELGFTLEEYEPKPKDFAVPFYDETIETIIEGIHQKNVFGKPYDRKFGNAGAVADGIPAAVNNYNHYSGHKSPYKERPTAQEIQDDPKKSPMPYATPLVQIFDNEGVAAKTYGTGMDELTYQLISAIGRMKRGNSIVDEMVAQELRRRLNASQSQFVPEEEWGSQQQLVPERWELRPDDYYKPRVKPDKDDTVRGVGKGDMVFNLFRAEITDANPPQSANFTAYDKAIAEINKAIITAENPHEPQRLKKAAGAVLNTKGVILSQPEK